MSAYAGLLFIFAALYGLSGLALLLEVPEEGRTLALIIPTVALVLAVTAFGLWRMQRWAWWLAMILQLSAIAVALLALINGSGAVSALVGLGIFALLIYWMYANRAIFAPAGGEVVAGGGGWWLAAIMVLIPIAVVVAIVLVGLIGGELVGAAGEALRDFWP